jgi:hypothetical protein
MFGGVLFILGMGGISGFNGQMIETNYSAFSFDYFSWFCGSIGADYNDTIVCSHLTLQIQYMV